jgi:CRISPR/Cas system-associated endonuclease Cas3-HD
MTVFPLISQEKLKIGNDTVVCYTLEENRHIALLILEADKYRDLYDNCTNLNLIKDSIMKEDKVVIKELNGLVDKQQSLLNDINVNYKDLIVKNQKLDKKYKKTRNVLIGSGVVNILLLILLL